MQQFQFEKLESFSNEKGEQTTFFRLKALEKSRALTIGNALRRVLLTDLVGTAITSVRFYGVNHEYGTIAGVREDVLELLLNLKQIKFHGTIDEPFFKVVEIEGPSLVTALEICDLQNLRVIDPKHYIATVAEKSYFKMELCIESGCGYRFITDDLQRESGSFLNIDTVFTPVKNVNFIVLDSYSFNESEVEDLDLQITTDGSLTPSEALMQSAKILQNLFGSLVVCEPEVLDPKEGPSYKDIFIEELHLSVRAYNCLKRVNIRTVEDLTKYSVKELKEIKNFGQKSAEEVIQKLEDKFDIRLS